MAILVTPKDAVSCRLCGATQARPGERGLCRTCWDGFIRSNGYEEITEADFDSLLARALLRQVKRASSTGLSRRCEHVSTSGLWNGLSHGYQCAMWACKVVDGRYLCHAHAKRRDKIFVSERRVTEYDAISRILAELAGKDHLFRKAMTDAIANSGPGFQG